MSRKILSLPSPAKLNLFLHITGRRPDGYHELQTIFQLLDYGDQMQFRPLQSGKLSLHCDISELENSDNLVLRAARSLQQATGSQLGAEITLQKHIPAGAGLGGGSSNAATTLVALNHLWDTGLSRDELSLLGARLGADVPVFVHGQTAWAEGTGEKLAAVSTPEKYFLVLCPACHVSTGEIFSNEQLTRNSPGIKMAAFLAGQTRNDCEQVVRQLYPQVDAALNWLAQYGEARMTGTGASVFAAFDQNEQALEVLASLRSSTAAAEGLAGTHAFVARGVSKSPVCSL